MAPHPLDILSVEETAVTRAVILAVHPDVVVDFREIYLQEPPKEELKEFLAAEHNDQLHTLKRRPARQALCQYDIIGSDRAPQFLESIVNLEKKEEVSRVVVSNKHHASLTL